MRDPSRGCRHGVGKGFSTRRAAVKFISRYALKHESAGSLVLPAVARENSASAEDLPLYPPPELQQNNSGLKNRAENRLSARRKLSLEIPPTYPKTPRLP